MDSGPGPPQQSPDDYSTREKSERTGVAVGITLGVLLLFATPLCLLYFANWRRRRRRQELRDLEGSTAVTQNEKNNTTQAQETTTTTLTTTVVGREDQVLSEAEIEEWRARQHGHPETELERLKRDPTSPLNTYSPPKVIKPLTPEEILRLDKTSKLQSLPVPSSSLASDEPAGITAFPTQLPPLRPPYPNGECSKQVQKCSKIGDCVSPWAVEHEPNPVIFKHLLGPEDERSGHEEVGTTHGKAPLRNEPCPKSAMGLTEQSQWNVPQQNPQEGIFSMEEDCSKESSPLEETSSSSPSSSTDSHDSSHPLIHSSVESHSPSLQTFTLPDLHQQLMTAEEGSQQPTQAPRGASCKNCNRTFKTTGQLNAHIHRKHVRRYSCELCPSTFHLKTDLKRHELTVHRKHSPTEARGFRCPNAGCAIPEKVFLRRDNFERHVARCARRKEGESPQKMSE